MSIYREQQQGGHCRKHAINAYLAYRDKPVLSLSQWQSYLKTWAALWPDGPDPTAWDFFGPAQENIVTYICAILSGVWTRVVPYSHIPSYISNHTVPDNDEHFIFVYSSSHIWGVRYHNGQWWLVDSMKPLSPIRDITTYFRGLGLTHGLVIPRHPRNAIRDLIEYVETLSDENISREVRELTYSLALRVLDYVPPPPSCDDLLKTIRKQYDDIRKQYDIRRAEALVICVPAEIELCQNLRAFVEKLLECLVI